MPSQIRPERPEFTDALVKALKAHAQQAGAPLEIKTPIETSLEQILHLLKEQHGLLMRLDRGAGNTHYRDALIRMLTEDEKTPMDSLIRRAWGLRQDEPLPTLGSIGMPSQGSRPNAANGDPEAK